MNNLLKLLGMSVSSGVSSISYNLLGRPRTSRQVIDKLERLHVTDLDIRVRSKTLDYLGVYSKTLGSLYYIRQTLVARYDGITESGDEITFNFNIPGDYWFSLPSRTESYRENFDKQVGIIRSQAEGLREKKVNVTVFVGDGKEPATIDNLNDHLLAV